MTTIAELRAEFERLLMKGSEMELRIFGSKLLDVVEAASMLDAYKIPSMDTWHAEHCANLSQALARLKELKP